jgi:WD40-like Beta Propeller Repeat
MAPRALSAIWLSLILIMAACTFTGRPPFERRDSIYHYHDSVIRSLGQTEAHGLVQAVLADSGRDDALSELDILNPYYGAVFPLDMASPDIAWKDDRASMWLVSVSFHEQSSVVCMLTDRTHWMPDQPTWEKIKARAGQKDAWITIYGLARDNPTCIVSRDAVCIRISPDRVDAPVFFQHMPLPFAYAARHPELSQWRIGDIAAYTPPPVVMENLPVCGNCHGFSSDGRLFGMDMDIHKDKGAYVMMDVKDPLVISEENFISWNDFQRTRPNSSMGLFSRISPDKSTVISTVKETSFFTMIPDIDYSQFFFPIKGQIAGYDRRQKRFFSLKGADHPGYVQTCPAWHPDGLTIVFARARHDPRLIDAIGDRGYITIDPDVRIEDLNRLYRIQFNLYTVPFNKGRGGKAVPLAGASHNGKSNYFPRYSPDGRWIVFTQSDTGLAIQPSSRLCIVPAGGGKARVLACNTPVMNSWHSWSPNGKWLVFSSKVNTPYTQLFLTHINAQGNATVPVVLSRFGSDTRACLVPEFVNIRPKDFPAFIVRDLTSAP